MSVEQRAKMLEEKLKEMPVEQVVEQNQSLLLEVDMLKRQLKRMGQQPVECLPLQIAERRLHDAVRRPMEGDMSAEGEIERMDAAIRANPEYEHPAAGADAAWQRANAAPLASTRSLNAQLRAGRGRARSRRGRRARRAVRRRGGRHRDRRRAPMVRKGGDIRKPWAPALQVKYSCQGLDIIAAARRYAVLPRPRAARTRASARWRAEAEELDAVRRGRGDGLAQRRAWPSRPRTCCEHAIE